MIQWLPKRKLSELVPIVSAVRTNIEQTDDIELNANFSNFSARE